MKALKSELGAEGVAQAISTAAPDTLLIALLEHLGTAQERLDALTHEFGPLNSDVIKAKNQVEGLRSRIRDRVDGVMLGLGARVLSLSNSLDNLEKEVALATTNDVVRANQTQPYFEAKRTLEELQRFRQILDMKIASEKIDVELPAGAKLDILNRAVPPLRPISPNLPRALALIALGTLLDVAGLLMLKAGPRIDAEPRPA